MSNMIEVLANAIVAIVIVIHKWIQLYLKNETKPPVCISCSKCAKLRMG